MINFNSGGEALTALLGGHVHATLGNPLEFMGHLQSGAVRAIGVFRDSASPAAQCADHEGAGHQCAQLPDVARRRRAERRAGRAAKYWEGVMAKVVASPQFKAYLKDNAAAEAPIAGAEFVKFLGDQDKPLPRPARQVVRPGDEIGSTGRAGTRRFFVRCSAACGSRPRPACPCGRASRRSRDSCRSWYGIALFALAVAILARLYLAKTTQRQEEEPIGKPLVRARRARRRDRRPRPDRLRPVGVPAAARSCSPWSSACRCCARSLVAAGVTAVLFLIFRTWLRVPLPLGPLGI